MVDSSEDGIMEEREELMVSLVDEEVKPIFRVAHFLKPTLPSGKKLSFIPSRSKISCSSLKVQFKGGFTYMKGWSKWVNKLKPLYQEIWKKAGIFEGIIASTFRFYRHNDLILALAERWYLETNTFILPWGEATITLEDMVVLGGFSVLGHCVLKPVKTKDSVEVEKTLCEAHKAIRARKMNIGDRAWMEHFGGRGDHLEHVAFLSLWLSRYVFPARSYQNVQQALFPIAIYLSQGIPIALAPAVLASIYRDLNLLKQLIVSSAKNPESSNSRCNEDEWDLILRAPFHFVQLWAWERFPNLQPKPSVIYPGEPRVARWHKVKKLNCVDPRSDIDSAAEFFLWRPYAVDIVENWDINKFYKETDEYVVVGQKMGSEIMIFARLIRASELVGMDCIEQYNAHRVSMQFGFDQDVPGYVNYANDHTPKIAWTNYHRPIKDVKLYIPSRFIESDVSRRYLEWWKNQNIAPADVVKEQLSRSHEMIPRLSGGHHEKRNASVCCEFLQKCDSNTPDCEMIAVESSSDDDNIPILESLRRRKLMKKETTVPCKNQEPLPSTQSQSFSASNDGTARKMETLLESKPIREKLEASNEKLNEDGDGRYVVKEVVALESKENNDKGDSKLHKPDSIELAGDGPNAEFLSTGPAKILQTSKASVEAPKVNATCTNITEGNMQMGNINNHEKGSSRIEMINILKLEMRIKNLENINAGKVSRLRTRRYLQDRYGAIFSTFSEVEVSKRMAAGAFYILKYSKAPLGEDAHFICIEGETIGVADGVGGWAKKGIDAGEYSRQLVRNAELSIHKQKDQGNKIHPMEVLNEAFLNTRCQGSSTACVLTLTCDMVHAVNVGDSGFVVIRDGLIVYKSEFQQRRFNCPFQLGNDDSCDDPSVAQEIKVPVKAGDVIVMGTDGLFDNVHDCELQKLVHDELVDSGELGIPSKMLAQMIAEYALENSESKGINSPYAIECSKAGKCRRDGGKRDDITVIVAHILPL